MRISKRLLVVAAAGLVLSGAAQADSVQSRMSGQILMGVSRSTGKLMRYDFAKGQTTTIGTVQDSTHNVLVGLDAAAYFPGFHNAFALWESPSDHKNKLVYIDLTSGNATVLASDVEGGHFTGATSVSTASKPYGFFAVQIAKVKPPVSITGLCNLNPNNNNNNEFTLTKDTGGNITRDALLQASLPASGTYYQGGATFVHLKPKGNGNQNGLIIDGAAYSLQNANTYDFSGSMQVRLFNDRVNGSGTPMGHWWLQIISGTVVVNNDVQILTPPRVTQVDQKTGTVTEIMRVTQSYSGLASTDGKVFYTTNGSDLYKIDTVNATETRIGSMPIGHVDGMEFVNGDLVVYDYSQNVVVTIDTTNGRAKTTPASIGTGDLGPVFLTPTSQDPAYSVGLCD